ncbi:MAG: major facilitator superfamily 1 [Mycobacterium sp.]|nr:major facilitator superfamily 1 [Mycobacterium sp.]
MSPGLRLMTDSLRVRNYRLFAGGQIVSLTGTWMQTIGQDWLVLQLSGNSGTALGIVTALQFTPTIFLTLYGGVLADRVDKRRMLIVVQFATGVLALGMGLLVVSGAAVLWHVYVLALLLGVARAFDVPTRQAFVSELVGPDLLPNAVALNSATFNTARIVGPAIGGLVIAWLGVGPAFLLNAVSFAAVIAALWRMDPAELFRGPVTLRGPGQVREGLRYVWGRPDLMMVTVLMLVVGTLGMNFNLTLPLLARAEFGVGAAQFGLLSTAFAAGALCGALLGTRRRTRPRATVMLAFAAVFGLLEIVIAFAPSFLAAAVLLVPTGAFLIAGNNAANSRMQLGADPALRGRVMALYMLVFMGGTAVGAPIMGAICEAYGVRSGLVLGGAATLVAAAVLAAARAWRYRPRDRRGHPQQEAAVAAGS